MLAQKYTTEDLKIRLYKVNERISQLIKERKSVIDSRTSEDLSRLRQLRIIVEQEINLREFNDFLK